jgi:hypothetical protein
MASIFCSEDMDRMIKRIECLTNESKPLWGKMSVDQMLAHCNVSYEFIFSDKHKKPNKIAKLFLRLFVKELVVGDKPYKKNSQTSPAFIIGDRRKFEEEKNILIENIKKVMELGESYFDGKESHSFGVLNAKQWNNMYYKHLDHHLSQFGV